MIASIKKKILQKVDLVTLGGGDFVKSKQIARPFIHQVRNFCKKIKIFEYYYFVIFRT